MDFYWEHFGLAASLVLSIFVLLGLGLRLRDTPSRRMFLWAMLAFFAINTLDALDSLAYSPVFGGWDGLYLWQDLLIPGFMVSLYFFVRGLTSSNPVLYRRDWLHLLPFLAGFLCLLPALLLPGDVRRGEAEPEAPEGYMTLVEIGESAFWLSWIVVLGVYGTLCVRRLMRHKRNIRALFSDLDGKTLVWLDGLVATILLIAVFVILDEARILMGYDELRTGALAMVFDILLAASFGLFALRAEPPLPQWSDGVLPPEAHARPSETAQESPETRYARSGLQPDDLTRLSARLEQRMQDGQLWRDHALNLRRLASEIAVPSIHLSEVLNTEMGVTFYDYVNRCRVEDACTLLGTTALTVLEISETVGFNSKSTFNSSFKKVTQQTPSEWRRAQRGTSVASPSDSSL